MQKGDMGEKVRLLVDGEELQGLVNFAEVPLEQGELEVPEFGKVRKITNGVITIPTVEATYKISRGSAIRQFIENWFTRRELHDVTVIRTDSHGAEFDRDILPRCELSAKTKPAYDAQNPVYAQVTVRLVPWDIHNVGPAT